MNKLITISKSNLKKALQIIGDQNRIGHPTKKRIVLAKQYFPGIDSGLELEECTDVGIDQLWEALKVV